MEFTEVITNRYSCKKFSSTEVSLDKLNAILDAGRVAPTAKNLQEQHIYVISNPETLEAIDQVCPCRYNAPVVLVVAYDTEHVFTYPGNNRDSGIEDASIVATHMLLAAYNAGVDSCWINLFDPEKLKRLLKLPENEEILMMMDLGYAAENTKPLSNHFSRKDLSKTVTYL